MNFDKKYFYILFFITLLLLFFIDYINDNFYPINQTSINSNPIILEIGDIESFGIKYLNQAVQLSGYIESTSYARLSGNKGMRVVVFRNKQRHEDFEIIFGSGLISDNLYDLNHYKYWIKYKSKLIFSGKVKKADNVDYYGVISKMPTLIISKIEEDPIEIERINRENSILEEIHRRTKAENEELERKAQNDKKQLEEQMRAENIRLFGKE